MYLLNLWASIPRVLRWYPQNRHWADGRHAIHRYYYAFWICYWMFVDQTKPLQLLCVKVSIYCSMFATVTMNIKTKFCWQFNASLLQSIFRHHACVEIKSNEGSFDCVVQKNTMWWRTWSSIVLSLTFYQKSPAYLVGGCINIKSYLLWSEAPFNCKRIGLPSAVVYRPMIFF